LSVDTAKQVDEIKQSLSIGSKSLLITNFDALHSIFPDFIRVSNLKSCTEMITCFFVRNFLIEIGEFLSQIRASSNNGGQDNPLPSCNTSATFKARNTFEPMCLNQRFTSFSSLDLNSGTVSNIRSRDSDVINCCCRANWRLGALATVRHTYAVKRCSRRNVSRRWSNVGRWRRL